MKKVVVAFLMMFMFGYVNASCNYNDLSLLNSKAANVKVSYDIVEKDIGEDDYLLERTFDITILNVTKDLYIKVSNDFDKSVKNYYNSDAKNDIVTFNWDNSKTVTNFVIEVYSSSETNCADEKLKTIYISTPRFNPYSERVICEEAKESPYCEKYVMFDEINNTEFLEKIANFKGSVIPSPGPGPDEPTLFQKIIDFINNNKIVIVSVLSLIIVLTSISIYRNNKKIKKAGLK